MGGGMMADERALSDLWRYVRHDDLVDEVIAIKNGCADLVGIGWELHVVGVTVSGLAAYGKLLLSLLAVGRPYLGFTAIEAWRNGQ